MSSGQRAYLIGIGGSGMLPLALLLQKAGYRVRGSDPDCPPEGRALLAAAGIELVAQPDAAQILEADQVVVTPAIPRSQVEYRAARRAGLPIHTRAAMLAALMAGRPSVHVAGSHGKSTTTAMLVQILRAAGGPEPGHMVGAGFVGADLPPARLGAPGSPFVTEACEAHGALIHWQPLHVILTNLDDDHADHYGGSEHLHRAFGDFLGRMAAGGRLVACSDDPAIRRLLVAQARSALTYGLEPGARLLAEAPEGRGSETGMALWLDGRPLGRLKLAQPGRHNLRNALAALAMALELGVEVGTALAALARFGGIARRLQPLPMAVPLRLFDDFAHHPAEITAALQALRETTSGRLIAVLEPQLHSRVTRMAPAFAHALASADHRFVLPVAALGEQGQGGDAALQTAAEAAGVQITPASDPADLCDRLNAFLRPGDTVLVMAGRSGAGLAPRLQAALDPHGVRGSAPSICRGPLRAPVEDLLTLLGRHAARNPLAPALEMGNRRLSYADLLTRAADLALALDQAGVRRGDSVGVCLGRTIDRVVAFVASLQHGAVFVPLDPTLPGERLALMLQAADVRHVVVNAASPALPVPDLGFINCAFLPERPPAARHDGMLDRAAAGDLAYIVFTSGTTGAPKAVEVSRGALSNYAAAAVGHFALHPGARVSQAHGFGFDVAVGDMAMALAAGACLVCPTDMTAMPGPPLGRFITESRITHLSLTPSALSVVPQGDYPALRHIIVVGEACPPMLVDQWARGRRFLNAYGPSEATVEATFARCEPGAPVTIGKPIDNMGVCLLDDALRPVPIGAEGEICLFGSGLARGYRHQPQLTAARFLQVDLPGEGPTRIYRTGDRARMLADGQLVYLGRSDSQLKFRGHRIEPAEVEAALCALPGIREAAVSLVRSDHRADRLIAHVVLAPGAGAPDPIALRRLLAARLPASMVPSLFLPVPSIPRTATGKRDRAALPMPRNLLDAPAPRTIGTPTEARIMRLIDEIAGAGVIRGTRDSLQDQGVDSLAMANLLFAVEAAFGITLDARFDEGLDTVEGLALMVDALCAGAAAPASAAPTPAGSGGLEALVAARITPHLVRWPGRAVGESGLLRRMDAGAGPPGMFWCCQQGHEFAALSRALENDLPVVGLRSGHLAVDYTADTLAAFARLYSRDIGALAPEGPLVLGGNCQGGAIMRETGLELIRQGREVALTLLMEQGRFLHFPAPVLLIFGTRSYLNPYGQMAAPEQIFRTAYPGGHAVEMLSSPHGRYFTSENIGALAAAIRAHLPGLARPPERVL